MLSLNHVNITSSDSQLLAEIYDILKAASIDVDMGNYHLYIESRDKFLSLFFDGSYSYDEFGIGFAYVELCEMVDGAISAYVYTQNGNLSIWRSKLVEKYRNRSISAPFMPRNVDLEISLTIEKSVKFRNYDVEKTWETITPMPSNKKK
jgi:hypothetical protein